jgi:hypothetical protein
MRRVTQRREHARIDLGRRFLAQAVGYAATTNEGGDMPASGEPARPAATPLPGPDGPDPSDIPDPMPEELREDPDQVDRIDPMAGDAPTG